MTDFVLVHGAFRGGWAWDRVRPLLEADGHRVFTPNLTAPAATLGSYIDQLVELFAANQISDAVLVGHSQGGFIARAASEVLADRLRALIYFDAPVPRHGQTAFDFRPAGSPAPAVNRGDAIQARPVEASGGLNEADAAWINERLVPQPVAPSMDPVQLTSKAALALREKHVFFSQTPEGFPCAITRAELDATGVNYVLIGAPHDGIVTHPEMVAAALLL